MNLHIEVQNLSFVGKQFEEMRQRSMQTRPLMQEIGMIMLQSTSRNFEEEGRPKRWKSRSPLTRKIYENQATEKAKSTKAWQNAKEKGRAGIEKRRVLKDVGGRKILSRNSDLKRSIVLGTVTNESVEVGSSLIYARIHQLGGTIIPKSKKSLAIPMANGGFLLVRKVTIPARPFLLLQAEDEKMIVQAAERHIAGGVT